MKAQFQFALILIVLTISMSSCSEEPFFTVDPPAALLKEQLQDEEDSCPSCRPAPDDFTLTVMGKEQLQDQEESRQNCPGCRPLPTGSAPAVFLDKEQLQGDSDVDGVPGGLCDGCDP